jgi:hypothetical protein
MMHENLDLSDINQVLHVVRNPYGWNEHVVRDARLKLADEFERLRAEVDALRADAERYRWLTEDHDSKEMRNRCLEILSRMPVMSYSAACAAIDAARKGE